MQNQVVSFLLDHSLGFVGQTVFLTVSLCVMLKLQGLNFKFHGLGGSAALACALGVIPYAGKAIATVVLLLCITKLIGSRTFTDAVFTVGIAYALTFCFNLFVLSSLLGDLRHPTLVRARTKEVFPSSIATTNHSSATTPTEEATASTAKPTVETVVAAPTPKVSVPTPTEKIPASAPQPTIDTNQFIAAKQAGDILTHFTVKGISEGAIQTIAIIGNGTNTFDVVAGDLFQVPTSAGKATVKCESADSKKIVLSVEGVKVTLLVRP